MGFYRFWNGVDDAMVHTLKLIETKDAKTMQILATIGLLGQIHQLCEGTTNLAWAAARVADYESIPASDEANATGDDKDLFDFQMVT